MGGEGEGSPLTRREKKVLRAMAYNWQPVTATEAGSLARMSRQAAGATLKKLIAQGLAVTDSEDRWQRNGAREDSGEHLVPVKVYRLTTAGIAAAPSY